jgi:Tfp pilus assembly protein PilV
MSFSSSIRCGFTLFEVAISLALVAFGVVSVMVLLPQGIKSQQLARFQIHAAVMMQNLSRMMACPAQQHFNLQVEAEKLTDNLYLNRAIANLENIADGSSLGLAPLPLEICQRIDSPNDEVRRILEGGGRIYYNLPGGPPQALVMGFVGLAQQNALPNHPCVAWPYWDQHPCAPSAWEQANWQLNPSWPGRTQLAALYAVLNSATTCAASSITMAKWTAYRLAAQDLMQAVVAEAGSGLSTTATPGGPVLNPPTALPASGWDTRPATEQRNIYPRPYVVWAASHLAHAAALGTGTVAGRAGGPTAVEVQYARDTFESCRQWVMRMRDDPYDWGAARQTAQQTAWDFPLVQHDLFESGAFPAYEDPTSDPTPLASGGTRKDRAWRVVTPRPVVDYGQARGMYGSWPGGAQRFLPPNKPNIDASWGDPAHFHLTRRFDPSERMRQVVFWAVDWQSYEDFETLPAPRHDASMGFKDSYGTNVSADWWGVNLPERGLYWTDAARTRRAGSVRGANGTNQTYDAFCDTSDYKAGYFMGVYGADRNGNGRLDRGALPAAARVRATLVARFTIYDRVLMGELRH